MGTFLGLEEVGHDLASRVQLEGTKASYTESGQSAVLIWVQVDESSEDVNPGGVGASVKELMIIAKTSDLPNLSASDTFTAIPPTTASTYKVIGWSYGHMGLTRIRLSNDAV